MATTGRYHHRRWRRGGGAAAGGTAPPSHPPVRAHGGARTPGGLGTRPTAVAAAAVARRAGVRGTEARRDVTTRQCGRGRRPPWKEGGPQRERGRHVGWERGWEGGGNGVGGRATRRAPLASVVAHTPHEAGGRREPWACDDRVRPAAGVIVRAGLLREPEAVKCRQPVRRPAARDRPKMGAPRPRFVDLFFFLAHHLHYKVPTIEKHQRNFNQHNES